MRNKNPIEAESSGLTAENYVQEPYGCPSTVVTLMKKFTTYVFFFIFKQHLKCIFVPYMAPEPDLTILPVSRRENLETVIVLVSMSFSCHSNVK